MRIAIDQRQDIIIIILNVINIFWLRCAYYNQRGYLFDRETLRTFEMRTYRRTQFSPWRYVQTWQCNTRCCLWNICAVFYAPLLFLFFVSSTFTFVIAEFPSADSSTTYLPAFFHLCQFDSKSGSGKNNLINILIEKHRNHILHLLFLIRNKAEVSLKNKVYR